MHAVVVNINLELSFWCAYNINTVYLRQVFQFIFQVVGKFFQPHFIKIAAQVYVHNGQIAQVYLQGGRLLCKVGGQILLGFINGILYFLQGNSSFYIRIKLHGNGRIILQGGTGKFFDLGAGDAFYLFFNWSGN